MMTSTFPYLSGNYAPQLEEITAQDLAVKGELPKDLVGIYTRIGSNPRFTPKGRYHWFDGDGMVHAVHFEEGRATYRNRFVRTRGLAAEIEANGPLWTGLEERPDLSNPRGPFKDTANTDLVYHAGQLLALWWLGGKPHVLSLPSLETCGIQTYGKQLGKGLSAHPKVDPVTGEMMFIDYGPVPPFLTYGVISRDGQIVHRTPIDLPGPRLQHDLAITERYTVLLDLPMYFDPEKLALGRTVPRFYREQPSRFGILPRRGTNADVRWFEASPCYVYHTVNAWEDGDKVVLLGCKIPNPLTGDPHNPTSSRQAPAIGMLRLDPCIHKWTFDLATGQAKEEPLDDVLAEFPRMDNRTLGRKSRFSYHQRVVSAETLLFGGVIKYDVERGTSATHRYPKGWFGGETAFCPRAGSTGEDDGYLCTFVNEEATGASELYVLDARDVERPPVARLVIPQRVPTGYHTWWVTADDLKAQRPLT
ncbi:MAG TPA: carotenoid oxygenase family protein [Polyangiaceae bacterium]|jgi:carotenoid cleavage dioxygenase